MIRSAFTNKWILGGVLLLILGGIAFIVLLERDMAQFKRQVMRDRHAIQERARAASIKKSTQEVSPAESNTTPSAERPITAPTEEVALVPERQTETDMPKQTALPTENADEAEVVVSAFGFGPFPEVPEGMTDFGGNPFEPEWKEPDYPNYEFSREFELIDRVQIKKWKEGDRDAVGASFQYNKVYLNYPNTVYVWYVEGEDEEGEGASLDTSGPVSLRIEQIQSGDIPPGIRIIDGETGGIDPFEYLGLNQ